MVDVLKIRTLGNLSLTRAGEKPLPALSRKAEALLVYLGRHKQPQTRAHLAELLWSERQEDQSLANLRTLLTRIRPHLEDHLIVSRDLLSLDLTQTCWLDANVLEEELIQARQTYNRQSYFSEERAASLEKALSLYTGEFLQGFYLPEAAEFEQWVDQERESLANQVEEALQHLANYRLKRAEYPAAISLVTRLLQLNPLHEEARRQMLMLLALSGQRSAALDYYQTYRNYLLAELDIAPEASTTDLYQRIKSGRLDQLSIRLEINGNDNETSKASSGVISSRVSQLQRVALFADTPSDILLELAALLEEAHFRPAEVIFEKGQPGECMYIIIEGRVRVHDGNRTLNELTNRDIFGEMALLDAADRLASVTALTYTRVWRLDQTTLYSLMERRVEVARGIIKVLSQWLRQRVAEIVELDARLEALNH